jgi:hypothetical protein
MREAKTTLYWSTAGILASGVVLMMTVTLADAAPLCLRSAVIESDQAIRSQARLVVLSDTCSGRTYVLVIQRPQPTSDRRLSGSEQETVPPALHAARGTGVDLTSAARE